MTSWWSGGVTAAAVLCAIVMNGEPGAIPLALALTLATGAGIGLINGLLIAFNRVSPFILTLGMAIVIYGATLIYSGGTAKGDSVEICLSDESGQQFACAAGEKKADEEATLMAALDAFHSAAFSPKVALTQSDLSSLDGSPIRVSADEVLKGVLGP